MQNKNIQNMSNICQIYTACWRHLLGCPSGQPGLGFWQAGPAEHVNYTVSGRPGPAEHVNYTVSGRPGPAEHVNCTVSGRPGPAEHVNYTVSGRPGPAEHVYYTVSGRPGPAEQLNYTVSGRPGPAEHVNYMVSGRPGPAEHVNYTVSCRPGPPEHVHYTFSGRPGPPEHANYDTQCPPNGLNTSPSAAKSRSLHVSANKVRVLSLNMNVTKTHKNTTILKSAGIPSELPDFLLFSSMETLPPLGWAGGGWVAGWLAGLAGWVGWVTWVSWLAGWLAGWLVGWLAGWLAGWLVGWLVGWLAGWLVGRSRYDEPVSTHDSLSFFLSLSYIHIYMFFPRRLYNFSSLTM